MTAEAPRTPKCTGGPGAADTDKVLATFRGAVAVSQATQADLDRLDAGHARRGLGPRPQPRRPAHEEAQLQALCEWLNGHGLNTIGVVTFSDDYASRHGVFSIRRGVQDVWDGLYRGIPMGEKFGYPWKFVLAGENHRTGRLVPHVHLALEVPDHCDQSQVCYRLWDYFFRTRGRSRFEPMRDVDTATLYGLKDTVKQSSNDPHAFAARLWHPHRRSGRPVHPDGYRERGGGGDPPR